MGELDEDIPRDAKNRQASRLRGRLLCLLGVCAALGTVIAVQYGSARRRQGSTPRLARDTCTPSLSTPIRSLRMPRVW
jgi:hypothetical protein